LLTLRGKFNAIRKPEPRLDAQLVQHTAIRSYPRLMLWARPVPRERRRQSATRWP